MTLAIRNLLSIAAITALVSGCAIQATNEREHRIAQDHAVGVDLVAGQRDAVADKRPFVRIRERQWVDTTPVISSRQRLPESLNCRLSDAPYSPSGIYELTQVMQEECGVAIRLSSDAVKFLWEETDRGEEGGDSDGETSYYQGYTPSGGEYGTAYGQSADAILMQALGIGNERPLGARILSDMRWENEPLEQVLNGLSARLGLSWQYEEDEGEIVLFHVTSRTFPIHAIDTETDLSSNVSSGTSLGSTGAEGQGESVGTGASESGQNTSVTLNHHFGEELRATIESMLSSYGRYSYSPSTGSLNVTDTPDVIRQVARYVESQNDSLAQQILLDIKVLSVKLDDSDSLGIDWDLVYQSASQQAGFASAFSDIASSAGSGSIRIIDADSSWNGSQVLINALSEQGRVSTISSPSLTTTNLQPTPIQVARQVGILARAPVTNLEGGQSIQDLVPGTVNAGLNMTALPYIIGNHEMLLQFAIELSELRDIRVVESGGSRIEIPELDSRIFSQRVKLRDKETLILSGFEQERNRSSRKGTGYARNFLMGGGMSSETTREVIVILITPTFLG